MTDEPFRLELGDCRELMATLDAGSVDAIVTDPPYGLEFMGKGWDAPWRAEGKPTPRGPAARARAFQAWAEAWGLEALRVLKPGGHLIAFGGTRMFHRLASGLEDAGFEVRDCFSWLYGSGYPKSLNVSKAIDRGFRRDETGEGYEWSPSTGPSEDVYTVTAFVRAARDRSGKTNRAIDQAFGFNGMAGHWTSTTSQPAVPTWPQWERLREVLEMGPELDELVIRLNGGKGDRSIEGTALAEREVIGRRLGKDASAGDLYRPGEGAYVPKVYDVTAPATEAARAWAGWGTALKPGWEPGLLLQKPTAGTVAANLLAHGLGALNIAACRTGELVPDVRAVGDEAAAAEGRWPPNVLLDEEAAAQLDAQSGQTRDGYAGQRTGIASASGFLGGLGAAGAAWGGYGGSGGASRFFYTAKASSAERHYAGRNGHPTVKPVELMRWLCRLVTPKGGLVLDPFMGSGSTGIAALAEGFRFIGFELDAEHLATAHRRIAGPLFAGSPAPVAELEADQADEEGA